jgi:hypothetical protein
MKTSLILNDLVQTIQLLRTSQRARAVHFKLSGPKTGFTEQFVIFTKPELLATTSTRQLKEIFRDLLRRMQELKVGVNDIKVFTGQAVRKYRIIDRCYERLNKVSRQGLKECSRGQVSLIKARALREGVSTANIVGGDQFLQANSEYSPDLLCDLVDNLGCEKFGAGVYGSFIKLRGQPFLVLNGFYPAQRAWLSNKNVPMVAFCLRGNASPRSIRKNLVGDIFPSEAHPKSFRGNCFAKSRRYGLKQVGIARNCIHYSANPIDACLYLNVLFGMPMSMTRLGERARVTGLNLTLIRYLYYAKGLEMSGKTLDLRDRIEDTSNAECLSLLMELATLYGDKNRESRRPRS